MWWGRKGTLNLPLVVFSAPTKSPRQKALIASGATQAATVIPTQATEKPGGDCRHKPHATDQSRIMSHLNLCFCTSAIQLSAAGSFR